jgi:hypothetical protein
MDEVQQATGWWWWREEEEGHERIHSWMVEGGWWMLADSSLSDSLEVRGRRPLL